MCSPSLTTPPTIDEESYLNMQSFIEICNGSGQAMVYGWDHCGYDFVTNYIESEAESDHFPIQRVFNFTAGDFAANASYCTTLEGRKFNVIKFDRMEAEENPDHRNHIECILKELDSRRSLQRQCKTAITNLVLENYKRNQEGLPLIPVFFVIDIDGNPKPLRIDHMTSKDDRFNDQFTHKELRRAFKLCTHENASIAKVACETFKFIKLKHLGENIWDAELTKAPWADTQFAVYWKQRKQLSNPTLDNSELNWRNQLASEISRYEMRSVEKEDKKQPEDKHAVESSSATDIKENTPMQSSEKQSAHHNTEAL